MPYNEPTFGESGEVYTDNVRNSLAHVKSAAEAAQATADNAVASIISTSQTADEAKEIAEAAKAYVATPTDDRVAEHVNDTASATRAALSATYVGLAGTDAPSVVKPSGDGRAGVWEYTHNDTTGYLFHLLSGAAMGHEAALMATGIDNDGIGLLLANKKDGRGIVLDQRATVTNAEGYGIHATQQSTAAPLVRLEQNATGVAPALQVLAFGAPASRQVLAQFSDPSGTAGQIMADTGWLEWYRPIDAPDSSTASNYVQVRSNNGVPENQRYHARLYKDGPQWYNYSGSAGQWWPFAIKGNGSQLNIQAGGLTGTVGTATLSTVIQVKNNQLGFFGAAAASRPAAIASPTADATSLKTAVDAIRSALTTLGLTA